MAGIAADRPDLIRSFAMDCGGLVHPDHVWHDMAQAWQTPEVGEQVVAAMTGASRADRLAMFEGLGMPGSIAEAHADAVDEAMGACVLTLYRSAVAPALPELGARLRAAVRRPALFVIAEQDPYVPADLAVSTAGDLGGTVVRFADQGHWWMIGNPAAAAARWSTSGRASADPRYPERSPLDRWCVRRLMSRRTPGRPLHELGASPLYPSGL